MLWSYKGDRERLSRLVAQPTLAQLGAAIRRLRDQRQWTLEELAGEADLHTLSIFRIETGVQKV